MGFRRLEHVFSIHAFKAALLNVRSSGLKWLPEWRMQSADPKQEHIPRRSLQAEVRKTSSLEQAHTLKLQAT